MDAGERLGLVQESRGPRRAIGQSIHSTGQSRQNMTGIELSLQAFTEFLGACRWGSSTAHRGLGSATVNNTITRAGDKLRIPQFPQRLEHFRG
jgi:hypothetical protein